MKIKKHSFLELCAVLFLEKVVILEPAEKHRLVKWKARLRDALKKEKKGLRRNGSIRKAERKIGNILAKAQERKKKERMVIILTMLHSLGNIRGFLLSRLGIYNFSIMPYNTYLASFNEHFVCLKKPLNSAIKSSFAGRA